MEEFASSVDRTESTWLLSYDEVPRWAQTKWHRPRPDDRALATCSTGIVLNPEDRMPVSGLTRDELCRRCFPVVATSIVG